MKTTHNVPLKALCLTLGVHFIGTYARKCTNKFGFFLAYSYLCTNITNDPRLWRSLTYRLIRQWGGIF